MASILKFVSKDDRTTEEQVYPHLEPDYRRLQLFADSITLSWPRQRLESQRLVEGPLHVLEIQASEKDIQI